MAICVVEANFPSWTGLPGYRLADLDYFQHGLVAKTPTRHFLAFFVTLLSHSVLTLTVGAAPANYEGAPHLQSPPTGLDYPCRVGPRTRLEVWRKGRNAGLQPPGLDRFGFDHAGNLISEQFAQYTTARTLRVALSERRPPIIVTEGMLHTRR